MQNADVWDKGLVTAMQTALSEAERGRTSPNPRVGAAVVRDGTVVATGYHARAGSPHAEVDALRQAGENARGGTLVVTLMPCNHQGRTGPCTAAIIEAGVQEVVVGCADPTSHANDSAEVLERAGVKVRTGLLAPECSALIADFEKFTSQGLPWVTLKAAVTLDGKLATHTGDSKWISGEVSRDEAHRLRANHDAILVGVGTVLSDNPRLTTHRVTGPDPIRVVLDAELRTPMDSALLSSESDAQTIIVHSDAAPADNQDALRRAGATLLCMPADPSGVAIEPTLRELAKRGIMRLLVEGGSRVHGSLLDHGMADRAVVFIAPRIVGNAEAPSLAAGKGAETIAASWQLSDTAVTQLGSDLMITGTLSK